MKKNFNILIVAQAGRLQYEALLFAVSLRDSGYEGKLFIAEPEPGPNWDGDPRIKNPELRAMLKAQGAEFIAFASTAFGQSYPYGNKIEALKALPKGEPFVFFDTDTLILENPAKVPFDFDRPSASTKVEPTWPQMELYGPSMDQIWRSAYDLVGLDFESAIDPSEPLNYWERYPYYNAGMFYYRCPHVFGARFLEYALALRDRTPPEMILQIFDPWLDQVALPLVIHSLGGSKTALEPGWVDGRTSCHYRAIPLIYAKEPDSTVARLEGLVAPNKIKKLLKEHEPFKRLVFQGKGKRIRTMFDQNALPRKEQFIRNQIKRAKLWYR